VIPRASTAIGKKKEEIDNSPLFQKNNLKHQRDIDEHKLKVSYSKNKKCFLQLVCFCIKNCI